MLIAEDHAVVREGARRILEHEPDLVAMGEAGDCEEAVRLAGCERPDVAIVDIAMPKLDGIEERARLLGGELRIISEPDNGTTVSIEAPC